MALTVLSSQQMQDWDQYTISHEPIASIDLMERAASLATKSILGRNAFQSVSIFCGPGNNGGDGLVIARLLAELGKKVTVYLLEFGTRTADFNKNHDLLPDSIITEELSENQYSFLVDDDLIIDCIFGSGLDRPVTGWIGKVIDQINRLDINTIAIDIPSGLYSMDNGNNNGSIIEANETLTFMSPKLSFFFEEYHKNVGNFRIIDIGLHADYICDSKIEFLLEDDIRLIPRKRFDHKGTSGCLLLIAGFDFMTGAAIIASKAALKSGARYLFTSCGEEGRASLNSAIPEVLWLNGEGIDIPDKVEAIGIGPGLGKSSIAKQLLDLAFLSGLPVVIDADAINLLSEDKSLIDKLPPNSILTPHIGELKRLIGNQPNAEDLLKAQIEFSKKHGVYILQKGPFSKLSCPDGSLIVNSTGNPGMSTAGMGDALTGIIASFLAQGYSAEEAAKFGMFIHGYAADQKAKDSGEIGLLASDVIDYLPKITNRFIF